MTRAKRKAGHEPDLVSPAFPLVAVVGALVVIGLASVWYVKSTHGDLPNQTTAQNPASLGALAPAAGGSPASTAVNGDVANAPADSGNATTTNSENAPAEPQTTSPAAEVSTPQTQQ